MSARFRVQLLSFGIASLLRSLTVGGFERERENNPPWGVSKTCRRGTSRQSCSRTAARLHPATFFFCAAIVRKKSANLTPSQIVALQRGHFASLGRFEPLTDKREVVAQRARY